jgi:hypothetical protein
MKLYTLGGNEGKPGDLVLCGCKSPGSGRCWLQDDGSHVDGDRCWCRLRPHPRCPVDAHRKVRPRGWLRGGLRSPGQLVT